jgi:uncharacterized protein (DUF697 family)/tellurite resistance protein
MTPSEGQEREARDSEPGAAERRALLTIALHAAFADGSSSDVERAEVRRVAQALQAADGGLNSAVLMQDVLLQRVPVSQAAAALTRPEMRRLAFELALGVCDADGLRNDAETRFLGELGRLLGLSQPQMVEPAVTADALATLPLDPGAAAPAPSEAELDRMILNAAILNGALELLPQALASMAIIPLQMKMVYRIGQAHGYALDRGHVREFLAAAGAGLAGQYLEVLGRRLAGGLIGGMAGRMAGGIARGATGAAFSFATTWALGQVARRYYAGGHTMTQQMLRETYQSMLGQARGLQGRYAPQIEQQARGIDVNRLVDMVRGQ